MNPGFDGVNSFYVSPGLGFVSAFKNQGKNVKARAILRMMVKKWTDVVLSNLVWWQMFFYARRLMQMGVVGRRECLQAPSNTFDMTEKNEWKNCQCCSDLCKKRL